MSDEWIEGLPEEPGDYWFYITRPPYEARVELGRASISSNGKLMCLATDFIWDKPDPKSNKRYFYRPATVPEPPEFDKTCRACDGNSPSWRVCGDCNNTRQIITERTPRT